MTGVGRNLPGRFGADGAGEQTFVVEGRAAASDLNRTFTGPSRSIILRSVDHSILIIRPAREADAVAVAAVYAPYVRDTAVSFETEAPSAAVMAQRIGGTLATHPWLVADRGGEVVGYAYAGKQA